MIDFVPEAGSTNRDLAARLAHEHVVEGHWLVADRQTSGRGRSGRVWCDGAGNFMGSTVVHPRFGDPPAPTLALVAGVAVHAVVGALVRAPVSSASVSSAPKAFQLKWPNDLMVGSAKLAGILLECVRDAIVIGIGVNLVAAPELGDRDTISLAQHAARCGIATDADRNRFAHALARQFDLDLQRWRDFGLAPIVRRWLAAAHPVGTPLDADDPSGRIVGTFAGLTDDGALRLRLADGAVRTIAAGEVRLLEQVRG